MRVSHHKPGKPYKRFIHIDGKAWSWRIKSANVWIRSPDGKTTIHTDAYEINGTTQDVWLDENNPVIDSYRDNSVDYPYCPAVQPSDIRRVIEQSEARQTGSTPVTSIRRSGRPRRATMLPG